MPDSESFQHYQVLKRPDGSLFELGRGAMGVTYKAFDTNLRCYVALKVINAVYLHSENARARFLREARAAAGLSHPNVAVVFHLGQDGENYFYAMEFIDGETVESFVQRHGPLAPALALQITLQVTRALRAAQRIGLVHRDIKPANLMIVREEDDTEDELHVKVIDFGLAKSARKEGDAASSATLTVAGFVGTPHYASPEQLEEKEIDTRSDIYALGVTLWYMLAGKPPFSGSMVQIMSQHLSRQPPFGTLAHAGIAAPVVNLVRSMLQKDPAARPQTPADLRREIDCVLHAAGTERQGGPAALAGSAGEGLAEETLAPGEAALATVVETSALSPESGRSAVATGLAPTAGAVLAGRYRLLRAAGPCGRRGQLFQALDMTEQRAVAVKLLRRDLLRDSAAFDRVREDIEKLRSPEGAHPNLVRLFSLERTEGETLLVSEWIEGFSLLAVLRHRGCLTPAEALSVLDGIAAAVDHARALGIEGAGVSLARVLLALDPCAPGAALPPPDSAARATLLSTPLGDWPVFHAKAPALTIPEAPAASESQDWDRTMIPVEPVVSRLAQTGGGQGGGIEQYLRPLALLVYESLGGVMPSAGAAFRCPPLPAFSERANSVLRSVLVPSPGVQRKFSSAREFAAALREEAGDFDPVARSASAIPPPVPREHATIPPPTTVPPFSTVPTHVGGRTGLPVHRPASGPLIAALVLLAVVIVLGGFGAVAYFFPFVSSLLRQAGGFSPVTAAASPSPQPTPEPPPFQPTAAPAPTRTPPSPSFTPLPPHTPAPALSRDELYQQAAVNAQKLTAEGDYAAALEAWIDIAQNYADRDPGRSGLDGAVSNLRAKFPPHSEAGERRFRQLQPLLEKAAANGSDAAMMYIADSLDESDPKAAANWYRQAADRGQTRAMVALGNLYFKGRGVPYDPAEVARWYEAASEKGDPIAKVYLAECYQEGKGGMRRNPQRAFQLLNEALIIDPKNSLALYKLGICYDKGQGTVPDARQALDLYKRAADLGNLNALGNLGVFYMNGAGLPRSEPRRAAELFREGAEKDNPICMFLYAQCLESGRGIGRPELMEARRWYRAAAERGFAPAINWCQRANVQFTPNTP